MIIDLKDEVWKDIPGSCYAVSTHGRIKRLSEKRIHNINKTYYISEEKIKVSCNNNTKKYWRVQLYYKNGDKITYAVHRLVAQAFVPNPDNKPQVNHIDGNKDNNHYSNLEWCDNEENIHHRYAVLKTFNNRTGSKCNFNKLTEEQVIKIANDIKNKRKTKDITKEFNISRSTIYELKAGRSWRHLNLFPLKEIKGEKYFTQRFKT